MKELASVIAAVCGSFAPSCSGLGGSGQEPGPRLQEAAPATAQPAAADAAQQPAQPTV